ncbi:acyl carrier protein [uncultured Eubacterium sp.]|uniref:acyl carrier protein n=1 Tax=uncultured Eubacterium sp. TaxID=165185 RepID=UPI0026715575|nr:acyl carrier protein [uncultured Eubacterium sp.]
MELERLIQAIADVLDLDASTITEESKFVDDLGADSLDVLEIVMGIEDEFGIQVPTDEAQSIITVGDAYDKIKKALEK